MSIVTHKFGVIEVTIKDNRMDLIELNQLAYNTLSLLIPVAKEAVREEHEQMKKLEEIDDDDEECSSLLQKAEQKKVNELYV